MSTNVEHEVCNQRKAGFATVAASELAPDAMPASKRRRLPEYPVPVLRLARLAVDQKLGFLQLEVVMGELGDRPQPQPMFLELGQVLDAGSYGA